MGWFKRFAAIGCGLVGVLSASTVAAVGVPACPDPIPADSWVVVNGEPLPDSVIARLQQLPGNQGKPVSAAVLVATLVDNRLLAAQAEKTIKDIPAPPLSGVGFDPAYREQQQIAGHFSTLFRKELDAFIEARLQGHLSSAVVNRFEQAREQIRAVLTPEQAYRTDMSPAQQTRAQSLTVATFTFPGRDPVSYTLWDLYWPQNIQMRLRMHGLEGDILIQALNERVAADFVMQWVESESGLSDLEQRWLRRYVTDDHDKQSLMQSMGLARDFHEDNAVLRARREALSQADIDRYYQANKSRFQQIESLSARHIRVPNEARADEVILALEHGMPFEQAVLTFSDADDRHADRPGALPDFASLKQQSPWLASIAATVEPGAWSRAIRAPVASSEPANYEIVWVDAREMGYFPADSETVRYLAGREIASAALINDYKSLRETLYDQSSLCVNTDRLGQSSADLKQLAATQTVRGAW